MGDCDCAARTEAGASRLAVTGNVTTASISSCSDTGNATLTLHTLLLQTLRANPEDLATLKEIQKLLLREVVRTEKKIREHKAELKTARERRTVRLQDGRLIWKTHRGVSTVRIYLALLRRRDCFPLHRQIRTEALLLQH